MRLFGCNSNDITGGDGGARGIRNLTVGILSALSPASWTSAPYKSSLALPALRRVEAEDDCRAAHDWI